MEEWKAKCYKCGQKTAHFDVIVTEHGQDYICGECSDKYMDDIIVCDDCHKLLERKAAIYITKPYSWITHSYCWDCINEYHPDWEPMEE